jgi:uncharacterized protein YegP (UPF0339 family)
MSKFHIKKSSANGQYYYNLKDNNYQIILSGEGYTTKSSCENGIKSVKENAPYDSRYDKQHSVNKQYYFNLKGGNGEIIGTSETYTTSSARDAGIENVKKEAPYASIEDNT